jgi:hypothetical protein
MNNIPAPKAGMTQREWAWRGNRIAFGCKHQRNKGEGAGSSRIGCGKILSSCPRGRVQRRSFVSEREMSLIDVEPPTPVAVANTVHMIAPFLCRDTVSFQLLAYAFGQTTRSPGTLFRWNRHMPFPFLWTGERKNLDADLIGWLCFETLSAGQTLLLCLSRSQQLTSR